MNIESFKGVQVTVNSMEAKFLVSPGLSSPPSPLEGHVLSFVIVSILYTCYSCILYSLVQVLLINQVLEKKENMST